ncbi:MAG TPA: two-component regulator propeller domain-containing protein [Anaerolineae bacterium]|nr:two-component regulator propeller domain-containing protein [Anaerolineae bacterium]HQI83850.1 two-component regulator propeller domain-containing protein [Anaerolineae bacterium]
MTGIETGLLYRLRATLLNSKQFYSDADVRVLFNDRRLAQWQYLIPEAANPTQRVDRVIGVFFNKQDEKQCNALVLLLYVLEDAMPLGDARRQELHALARELEESAVAMQLATEVKAHKLDKTGIVFPLWLKILLPISLLTLGLIVFLVIGRISPASHYTPPNPNRLQSFGPSDLNVDKLALAQQNGETTGLWIAAHAPTSETASLYELRYPWEKQKTLEPVYPLSGQLMDMEVDCKGNVWLALETPPGVRVYNPTSGADTTFLDKTTTNGWLQKSTVYALASRCREDGSVEVWLGREGVHTLRYAQDYPRMADILFVSPKEDAVYATTRALTDVLDLHYDRPNETLWGLSGRERTVFQVPLGSLQKPSTLLVNQPMLWALGGGEDGSVWVTGENGLSHIEPDGRQQDQLGPYAWRIAVDPHGQTMWLGNRCSADTSKTCWPLAWYQRGMDAQVPVPLSDRKEVRSIVIDTQGVVWIGTEKGLIYYASKK